MSGTVVLYRCEVNELSSLYLGGFQNISRSVMGSKTVLEFATRRYTIQDRKKGKPDDTLTNDAYRVI